MKTKRTLSSIIKLLFAVIPLLTTALLYTQLPSQIPMHWSIDGTIDRYAAKEMIWLLACIPFAMLLLSMVLPKIDPKKENYERFQSYYDSTIIVILAFLSMIFGVTIVESLYPNSVSVPTFATAGLGLMFMYIGNVMPKMKSNYFMGIKTPWTLADSDVWHKTHRLGGFLWFISGIGIAIGAFFLEGMQLAILVSVVVITIVIVPSFMSYLWYKKLHY